MKPFAWKLTSAWMRVPTGARKVRMIFKGRWTIQGDQGEQPPEGSL